MKENKKFFQISNQDWQKLVLELLVVFLGITAGFLLNNWQLKQQEKQLEQKYLAGFLDDVKSNIQILNENLEADSLWLKRVQPNLFLIREGKISLDSAEAMIKQVVSMTDLELHIGTYESITNSGNLNIILDFQLKKQIVEYHINVSQVKFHVEFFYQYFNDFVIPYVFENYNLLGEKLVNPKVVKTTLFSNVITGYFSMVQQRQIACVGLLQNSNLLKAALEAKEEE